MSDLSEPELTFTLPSGTNEDGTADLMNANLGDRAGNEIHLGSLADAFKDHGRILKISRRGGDQYEDFRIGLELHRKVVAREEWSFDLTVQRPDHRVQEEIERVPVEALIDSLKRLKARVCAGEFDRISGYPGPDSLVPGVVFETRP